MAKTVIKDLSPSFSSALIFEAFWKSFQSFGKEDVHGLYVYMNIFTVKMWVLYHNQDKGAWSPIKPEGHNAEISQG